MKHFNVRIILCGWHLQRNFVSHLNKLKSSDATLYNKIISLPFVTSVEKFEGILEEIDNSEHISQKQKEYVHFKLKTKELWAKCLLKSKFAGGVSTTSRVECLHAVQKKTLTSNSNSNLQQVFHGFREIEKTQIIKFREEFYKISPELLSKGINSLKEIEEKYSEYLYKKVYPKFCKALNYKHEFSGNFW